MLSSDPDDPTSCIQVACLLPELKNYFVILSYISDVKLYTNSKKIVYNSKKMIFLVGVNSPWKGGEMTYTGRFLWKLAARKVVPLKETNNFVRNMFG